MMSVLEPVHQRQGWSCPVWRGVTGGVQNMMSVLEPVHQRQGWFCPVWRGVTEGVQNMMSVLETCSPGTKLIRASLAGSNQGNRSWPRHHKTFEANNSLSVFIYHRVPSTRSLGFRSFSHFGSHIGSNFPKDVRCSSTLSLRCNTSLKRFLFF